MYRERLASIMPGSSKPTVRAFALHMVSSNIHDVYIANQEGAGRGMLEKIS